MVPIKAKSLIKEVSKQTNIPEDIVEKIVTYYFDCVKKKLTSLDITSLILEGFGKFYIKQRSLEKEERKMEANIRRMDDMGLDVTPKIESMGRVAKEDIVKVQRIKKIFSEISQKKDFITLYKITYKDDKIREALEGQVEDSTGNS